MFVYVTGVLKMGWGGWTWKMSKFFHPFPHPNLKRQLALVYVYSFYNISFFTMIIL